MNNDTRIIKRRKPSDAAALSALLPGLGQIYSGHFARGILWTGGSIALMIAAIVTLMLSPTRGGLTLAFGLVAVDLVIWFASILEAMHLAKLSDPNYSLRDYNRWYVYVILLILCGFGSAFGFSFVLRERVIETFVIPGASMEPTISRGDGILTLKEVFLDRDPERGELVVFRNPEQRRQHYVKRVIGVAGDRVEWRENGDILVNDFLLPHDPGDNDTEWIEKNGSRRYRIRRAPGTGASDRGRLEVPPSHCFVLGDNRFKSKDSRHFGTISYASLVATPVAKVWGGFERLE